MKKAAKIVCAGLFLVSLFLGFWGILFPEDQDIILWATFCVWLCGIIFACYHFKRLFVFFFFEVAIFFFLLGRPLMDFLDGKDWVAMPREYYYPTADAETAMKIMFCALLFMLVGAWLANRQGSKSCKQEYTHILNSSGYMPQVRFISLMLFLISFLASSVSGIEKISFIQTHSYAEFYIMYKSQLPYIVYAFSTFLEYSLFAYLATMPSKRDAVVVLVLYITSGIPNLIVGSRGSIAFSLIFCLVYFLIREFGSASQTWIGKKEKIAIIIGIPALMGFFGIYNYIRDDMTVDFSFLETIGDFVYRQGVTFSWFSSGLGAMNRLPNIANPHYTFGPIMDYFQYGTLGQIFDASHGLGVGNNLLRATAGNSLAHHLSYIILGDSYLAGHGTGSCYLLELFIDYGFFGVVLFSFLIGFFFIRLTELIYRHTFMRFFSLNFIYSVFSMPRGSVSEVIQYLYRPPFWIVTILCFVIPLLLKEEDSRRKEVLF